VLNPNIVGLAKAIDGRALKLFKRGTHRTTAPDETLARVAPLARQIGITRVGNVTGLDHIGIPVAIAVRPNSRSFSVSQGKGLNLSQARASALMEAIELFHGEDITARTRVASLLEISMDSCVVEPATLCGTGTPLPDGAKIAWMEGYDLLCRESCWVPWEIVHTDYTFPTSHSGLNFLSGTNGIAAGNHMLEALSAAICELIEHDAVALWHAARLHDRARCRVDMASIDDEDCCALLDKYQRAGVAPRVWDVTSDMRISAFVCDIPATGDVRFGALRRFRGAGCHPNRAIALARALTEAAQIRLTYISGNRDDLPSSDYEESQQEKLGAALLDAVSQDAEPRDFCDIPNFDADDLALDLNWELQCLQSVGVKRVIAIDLTRSDIGIPVVRIVTPGLEWDCTHPDYVPGARARRAGLDNQ
jgi:ribosomal protein S12 methylthiotransferase accessory factor